nr:GNAT family N-acetyltransferase [Sphingobacterium daejeonense]
MSKKFILQKVLYQHERNPDLQLRKTVLNDLEQLFEFQTDKEGIHQAAFTPKDPTDKNAYLAKYEKILQDPSTNNQTILLDNVIVGSMAKFILNGKTEITYWIDSKYWGKGIATKALSAFLEMMTDRPVFGRVTFDNFGSQKVLEKCDFVKVGENKGFANARQEEIVEFIYELN